MLSPSHVTGSLSIPSAFASLGMVAGVILTVGLGLVAIYTSYVVGQVRILSEWCPIRRSSRPSSLTDIIQIHMSSTMPTLSP